MGDSAIHALAGAVGGGAAMALTYPLVNISTRAAVSKNKDNKGFVAEIARTLKTEGVAGLYAGLGSSLLGIAVTNATYYGAYEETRSTIIRRRPANSTAGPGLSTLEGIAAGMIAGSITTLATSPVWTVQAYQSTHAVTTADGKKKPMSAAQAVKEILKADGIKGLWRGLGPALILVINPVIQYTSFERMVSLLLNYRAKKSGAPSGAHIGRSALSDWDLFLLGAISKLFATGTTYPYLVVKSRLQAATHKYSSSVKAVVQILKEEGLSGLYAGLGPKVLQSALTAAFMFVAQRRIYEFVKSLIVLLQQRRKIAA